MASTPLWVLRLFDIIGGVVGGIKNNGSQIVPGSVGGVTTTTQVKLNFIGAELSYSAPESGEAMGTLSVPLNSGSSNAWQLDASSVETTTVNVSSNLATYNPTSHVLTISAPSGIYTPVGRKITLNTSALRFTDPYFGSSELEHDFSHDMVIGGIVADHSDDGLMSAADKIKLDNIGLVSGTSPGLSSAIAHNRSVHASIDGSHDTWIGGSPGQWLNIDISTGLIAWASLPVVSSTTNGMMTASEKNSLDAVLGASILTSEEEPSLPGSLPISANRYSGNAGISISVISEDGLTTQDFSVVDGFDSRTFRRRILQSSGTPAQKLIGYENAYIFTGAIGVNHTITVPESEWQGAGAVDASSLYHVAHIEVEIILAQADYVSTRSVHRAIIYKLRTAGTSWAIGYDGGTRDSSEDVPQGAINYCNFILTLSGTNNGTLNLTFAPSGGSDPKSDIMVFLKVRGGGKFA